MRMGKRRTVADTNEDVEVLKKKSKLVVFETESGNDTLISKKQKKRNKKKSKQVEIEAEESYYIEDVACQQYTKKNKDKIVMNVDEPDELNNKQKKEKKNKKVKSSEKMEEINVEPKMKNKVKKVKKVEVVEETCDQLSTKVTKSSKKDGNNKVIADSCSTGNANTKIIFIDDKPKVVPPGSSPTENNSTLQKNIFNEDEANVKDEDIDNFIDELDEEDNKQYEDWVKLIEEKLHSNKKSK